MWEGMSPRESEGGGQMGEAHREDFLRVFSKPALLQHTDSCGIPQAFSPWCVPMEHTWLCWLWHSPLGWPQNNTTAPCSVCHLWLWGHVGIVIGLLFLSSFYFICTCPTNKAGSENIDIFAKGCLILLPCLTCISQPLEEYSNGVLSDDLVGLH